MVKKISALLVLLICFYTVTQEVVSKADLSPKEDFKSAPKTVMLKTDKVLISKPPSYDYNNVTNPSNATESYLLGILEGYPVQLCSQAFIQAEKEYGVNALVLVGIVCLESDYCRSYRAETTNNLWGAAVYGDSSSGCYFDSWNDSILSLARTLKLEYITKEGRINLDTIAEKFCVTPGWGNTVSKVIDSLLTR